MNSRSTWPRAAFVVAALLLLTGCSQSNADGELQLSDLLSTGEQQRQLADCMRERGWDAEFQEDTGAVVTDIAKGQDSAYEADTAECSNIAGMDFDGNLTDEAYALTFDWYSSIAECLEDAGWDVPSKPTLQSFQSTYDSSPWIPWSLVPPPEMRDARKACPQIDPENY